MRPVLGPIRQQQSSSWLPAVREQSRQQEGQGQQPDRQPERAVKGGADVCSPYCYLGLQAAGRQASTAVAQPAARQQQQTDHKSHASSPVPVPGSGLLSLKRRRSDAAVKPDPVAVHQATQAARAGEQEVSSPPANHLQRSSSVSAQGTASGGRHPAKGATAAAAAAAIAAASNVPARRRSRDTDNAPAAGTDEWSAWEEALLQQGLEVGLAF